MNALVRGASRRRNGWSYRALALLACLIPLNGAVAAGISDDEVRAVVAAFDRGLREGSFEDFSRHVAGDVRITLITRKPGEDSEQKMSMQQFAAALAGTRKLFGQVLYDRISLRVRIDPDGEGALARGKTMELLASRQGTLGFGTLEAFYLRRQGGRTLVTEMEFINQLVARMPPILE